MDETKFTWEYDEDLGLFKFMLDGAVVAVGLPEEPETDKKDPAHLIDINVWFKFTNSGDESVYLFHHSEPYYTIRSVSVGRSCKESLYGGDDLLSSDAVTLRNLISKNFFWIMRSYRKICGDVVYNNILSHHSKVNVDDVYNMLVTAS